MTWDGENRRSHERPADQFTHEEVKGLKAMFTDYRWWLELGKKLKVAITIVIAIPALVVGIKEVIGWIP